VAVLGLGSTAWIIVASIFGLIITLSGAAFAYFYISYIKSFQIKATILKPRRDGYKISQDWARQHSDTSGENKLQLLTEKGLMGTKAEIDWPGEQFLETWEEDGESHDHIYLLEAEGDSYTALQVDDVEDSMLDLDIPKGDQRQALIGELRNAEEKYEKTGFWDAVSAFAPWIGACIVLVGAAILFSQIAETQNTTSENIAATADSLADINEYCIGVAQNVSNLNTTSRGNTSLLPGQSPTQTPSGGG